MRVCAQTVTVREGLRIMFSDFRVVTFYLLAFLMGVGNGCNGYLFLFIDQLGDFGYSAWVWAMAAADTRSSLMTMLRGHAEYRFPRLTSCRSSFFVVAHPILDTISPLLWPLLWPQAGAVR